MVYTRGKLLLRAETQQISGSKPYQNCGNDWSPKTGSREGTGKIFTLVSVRKRGDIGEGAKFALQRERATVFALRSSAVAPSCDNGR